MAKFTLKQVLRLGRAFLRENNVKFRFVRHTQDHFSWGWADLDNEIVAIYYSVNSKPNTVASVIMHEYYHIWCYRNGKYPAYHCRSKRGKQLTLEYINAFLGTALKAERFVDGLAKKNFHSVFPGTRYIQAYRNQSDLDDLEESQLNPARWIRAALINRLKRENKKCA